MTGYFEKGKWVEEIPLFKYQQENRHTRPLDDYKDVLQVYLKVMDYYKQQVYRCREMPFRQRLKFLIFPRQVIREL